MTVRWARLKGADGYSVRVTGSDGRKEVHFLSRKRRRVRILTVAPGDAPEGPRRGLARHPLDRRPGAHRHGAPAEGERRPKKKKRKAKKRRS